MKQIISIVILVLFLSASVFAVTNIKNVNETSKKQEIIEKLNNRDFVIFSDPVIFQDFVQFSDSVSMFETYIQSLFTDFIDAESIDVESLESEYFYTEELETEQAHISEDLVVDENMKVMSLAQNSDEEYGYACLNSQGEFFRSGIPCPELNVNSDVELWFIQIGEVINLDFQENEFRIELLNIFNESNSLGKSALFKINGDYDIIEEGNEANIDGLNIQLDNIFFDENEFQRLKIILHELASPTILLVEDFPFEYEFTKLYENLRFNYSENSEIQDIEIIFAEAITGDTTLEVNDVSVGTVLAGESIILNNIALDIILTNFINESLDSMIIVVNDIR